LNTCALVGSLHARRKQREAEEKLIAEETARRVEEEIQSRVEAALNSDAVQKVIHQRLKDERAKLEARVTEQLRQEEKALLDSAHAKRVCVCVCMCVCLAS
jgi:arginine/glutamate-rich protein 1